MPMFKSVAILADIHGMLPALDAVLAEPDVARSDAIVVLGDVASGPQPTAVLDRLMTFGPRVMWVEGNADRELVEVARGLRASSGIPISDWAAGQLSDVHVDLLANLPHPVTIPVEGFGDILMCHATPRLIDEIVLVDSSMGRWREVLANVSASISTIVCGHTHMPFMRVADGRRIVNPGSVGMTYGLPGAHWASLERGTIRLHQTRYDVEAAFVQITQMSTYPDIHAYLDQSMRHPASDGEALGVFGGRME